MQDAVLLGVLLTAIVLGFALGVRHATRRQQQAPLSRPLIYPGSTSLG